MDCSRCENIQEPVNHIPSKYAPKPSEPPASEETSTRAVGVFLGKSQKLTPCQSTRNWCHQCQLRWNSLFRSIVWRVIRVNIVMQFLLLCSSELYSVSCRIMFWHLKLCCDFLHYVFHFRLISSRPPNYDFRYWHSVVRYDLLNNCFAFLNYVLHFRL